MSAPVSIVIPAYNEERLIAQAVACCLELAPRPEVIVADGASSDGTVRAALAAGARVIHSSVRGRSLQMNAGARAAAGEWLLFLHADSHIQQPAWEELEECVWRQPALIYGAFRRRYQPPSLLLAAGSYLAAWRGRLAGIFLGDQAIFVRRSAFEAVGGYRPILLFEDVDLCRRLRRAGRWAMLRSAIVTSQRRFQAEGVARRYARNVALWLRYSLGQDPNALARLYYPGYFDSLTRDFPESSAGLTESKVGSAEENHAIR